MGASFGLESAKATVSTVAALQNANAELKQAIRNDLNVDDIDDVADDMEVMNDALGRNFATPEYIDEDDLEAELDMLDDELEEEFEENATPAYLQPSALPSIPTAAPGGKVPVSNKPVVS